MIMCMQKSFTSGEQLDVVIQLTAKNNNNMEPKIIKYTENQMSLM